jgi:hypothetical protein
MLCAQFYRFGLSRFGCIQNSLWHRWYVLSFNAPRPACSVLSFTALHSIVLLRSGMPLIALSSKVFHAAVQLHCWAKSSTEPLKPHYAETVPYLAQSHCSALRSAMLR